MSEPPARPDHPVQIVERPLKGAVRLKSWDSCATTDPSVLAPHLRLPTEVGAALAGSALGAELLPAIFALCLGPGEWFLLSFEQPAQQLLAALARPHPSAVLVDLTAALATFELSGSSTRDLLAMGCGLDLHPSSFPPGRCARTRFAQIALIVHCRGATRFELHVGRSYAGYLEEWLRDAALNPA